MTFTAEVDCRRKTDDEHASVLKGIFDVAVHVEPLLVDKPPLLSTLQTGELNLALIKGKAIIERVTDCKGCNAVFPAWACFLAFRNLKHNLRCARSFEDDPVKTLRFVLALSAACGMFSMATAQEKFKFEPKFEKDKAFFQQVSTSVTQVVNVSGGAESKLNHEQIFMFKWEPKKFEADKWTVELTIEGAKLKVDMAGNPVNYDSTADQPAAGNNPGLTEFFKNLIGSKFTITYGKGFAVENVEGRDEFLKKLGTSNPQIEGLLKKILTAEALKEMSDPLAGLTPPLTLEKTIPEKGVNDKWTKTNTMALGPIGSYDRSLEFTVKAKTGDVVQVDATANLTYKSPTTDADGLLFRIKEGSLKSTEPKAGTAPGVFKYNVKTGQLERAELNVTMKGTLTVTIGTTESKVELFQEQKTVVETKNESYVPAKK